MSVNPSRFSLFKRPNQIYYIGFYRDGKRRWKSTGVRTKPEALRVLTQFRELMQERSQSVLLVRFVEQFLAYSCANHSPNTVRLFRAILKRLTGLLHDVSLREITPEHIDSFKTRRLREIKPVSVNVELRMLKSAFNTAKRWKLIDVNPTDGIAPATVPEVTPAYFTPEGFNRFVGCLREGWLKEIVLFAVLTGMRQGEILSLRWSAVDFKRRVAIIQTSATFRTKSGKMRAVPLSETALYLLKAKQGKSLSENVFTLNDRPINAGWLSHIFKRYVREAAVADQRLHFHSLRHTFASWLVQGGATLYEVQKLLGHSSSKVTEVYSHLQPDQLHDTVNRITIRMN